jgi:hypothetical protein
MVWGMCMMCEGFSQEEMFAHDAAIIEEHGYLVTGVGSGDPPHWAYTVGLLDRVRASGADRRRASFRGRWWAHQPDRSLDPGGSPVSGGGHLDVAAGDRALRGGSPDPVPARHIQRLVRARAERLPPVDGTRGDPGRRANRLVLPVRPVCAARSVAAREPRWRRAPVPEPGRAPEPPAIANAQPRCEVVGAPSAHG